MTTTPKNSNDIRWLATYGTLRDDDNSGAAWNKPFIEGMSHAQSGRLKGYQLLEHPTYRYPFAIETGNSSHMLVVRLLTWPTQEKFEEKIKHADLLEGDEYERRIVEIDVHDGKELAYIYICKRADLEPEWSPIPSGDWLQRKSI